MNNLNSQKGLSLIELLVSMVIALIVLAGVINTVVASKQSYLYDEQVAYIQENSRFALDILSRELRETGYMGGCNLEGADVALVANIARPLGTFNAEQEFVRTIPIEGFEGDTGAADIFPVQFAADVWGETDAFIIRRADSDNSFVVTGHNPATSRIDVSPNHGFDPGALFLITDSDCATVGIFSMTGPASSGTDDHVLHASGAGATNNCSGFLGANPPVGQNEVNCDNTANLTTNTYTAGSELYHFIAKAFYVATSSADAGARSLYSVELSDGGSFQTNELVSGVEDFQVLYGVDNDSDQDGKANRYMTADQIALDEAGTVAPFEAWNRVVSIRIQMVMRSRDAVLPNNRSVTLLGVTYNDRFMRQQVSATIQLRNVALPANGV